MNFVDSQLFDKLKQEKPKFRHKIVGISGDCSLPGLGIDAVARQSLRDNVNIVLHVAATVRFDEKLKLALGINVSGTREMLLLSREMFNLKVCKSLISQDKSVTLVVYESSHFYV